jgi:hypothetical protein
VRGIRKHEGERHEVSRLREDRGVADWIARAGQPRLRPSTAILAQTADLVTFAFVFANSSHELNPLGNLVLQVMKNLIGSATNDQMFFVNWLSGARHGWPEGRVDRVSGLACATSPALPASGARPGDGRRNPWGAVEPHLVADLRGAGGLRHDIGRP